MNSILKTIMIAVAMVTAIPSFAVSDKEMEAAKTLAAKHYLRYANNGSDYLDKLSPSSMAELSAALKPKEKENLKSFNAVVVPKDYKAWDKQKLVEYWSTTFFKQPGLKDDGKKCLGILAKNLNKINVSAVAPAPAAPPQKEDAAPETPVAENPSLADAPDSEAAAAADRQAAETAEAELEALASQASADAGLGDEMPKKSSGTIWYVAILVALIGVVVWLVVYASKSMKEAGVAAPDPSHEKEIREAKKSAMEAAERQREQYAASFAAKNEEVKQLKAKINSLEAEVASLRDALERERRRILQSRSEQPAAPSSAADRPAPSAPKAAQQPPANPAAAKQTKLPPVVYLGYVNQRGLFVKASRSLNQESSVYYMDIPDGKHGTFMVVNDTEVLDRVLADPSYWLSGGCIIENPDDADIAVEIVTLEAGQAVFADNSCRVVRKARIKFV